MSDPIPALDISTLVNAVDRLREGLERHRREPQDEMVRDGLIQRFEFTYELSHRMLRRYLRMVAPTRISCGPRPWRFIL